jgi:uncharacterized protein
MAVQPTYPGVYVQEVPSGVRTIAGVSTSITAFVGAAKRGPVDRAVTITSYADYERLFGGLVNADPLNAEMSFAVRQFFLNGGTQAIIVRVARNAVAASRTLQNAAATNVLVATATDRGADGNRIELRVTYPAPNPDSLFTLTISYTNPDNPSDSRTETFANLSMNSAHPRHVLPVVNGVSSLVTLARDGAVAGLLGGLGAGTSLSGVLPDVGTLLDDTHNRFRVAINGSDALTIQLDLPADVAGGDANARLDTLCAAIQTKIQAQANGNAALAGATCARSGSQILITSGAAGENSRVEVLPGLGNDAAARLQLGIGLGGRETDGAAALRPRPIPDPATLTTGDIIDADLTGAPALVVAGAQSFRLSLDGGSPLAVDLAPAALAGANHNERAADLAARVQTAVRALRPASPAFADFTCRAINGTNPATDQRLVLASGTRGAASSVVVSETAGDTLATRLHLLVGGANGATPTTAPNMTLTGGNEQPLTDATAFAIFTGNRAARTGLYALEATDLFNILCFPGITDSGILMEADAYCKERRAFLIADAPPTSVQPATMVATMAGTALPKSDHAAVYYPWIQIANPLNGGQLRTSAPCGTLAGLYARIDANRGVWKAPAGTEATLTGVRGMAFPLTDRENGTLNPLGVNCLRMFPDSGAVSWGGRTLAGADSLASEWKYVPVRRTALFIEESLFRGLKWVVFEPNAEPLWAQIRLNVGAFMHNLFRQGAFAGAKRDDAYFVRCDATTTTQNDVNLGIVNIWVGFAPLKPAEFVVLYLQQMAGQIQV